jgi:hypothetical protein
MHKRRSFKKFWTEFRDMPWIMQYGAWLALVLMGAALLLPGTAKAGAEMVYKSGELTIRLHDVPCRSAVLAEGLKEAGSEKPAQSATILISGNAIPGCWGISEDKVLIVDVMGNGGYILAKDFKPNPGV